MFLTDPDLSVFVVHSTALHFQRTCLERTLYILRSWFCRSRWSNSRTCSRSPARLFGSCFGVGRISFFRLQHNNVYVRGKKQQHLGTYTIRCIVNIYVCVRTGNERFHSPVIFGTASVGGKWSINYIKGVDGRRGGNGVKSNWPLGLTGRAELLSGDTDGRSSGNMRYSGIYVYTYIHVIHAYTLCHDF